MSGAEAAASPVVPRRLAIIAHYDPRGKAAPHFLRLLDQIGGSFSDVVVASTAALDDEAIAAIEARATLVRRPNVGHDFGSWRDVLEAHGFGADFDEVLLTNDSYVGYLRPLDQMIREMHKQPVEVWGMTKSHRHGEHIQSYFLYFTAAALHSQTFERFWAELRPAHSRDQAIVDQEIGVSRALLQSGFRLGSYFTPTTLERRLATVRGVHWLRHRQRTFPTRFDNFEDSFFRARKFMDPAMADNLNWSAAFADAVFDRARLPVVKFDTLRYDPYFLDAGHFLNELERAFPAAFSGVRQFLEETKPYYGRRRFENYGDTKLMLPTRALVGYGNRHPISTAQRAKETS
ncbi:hypothetical protein GCM10009777_18780 [Microbacterium pumilum]|uniref:Rhamnan synthesis protein F n=1 Tax=Microbacterium pumilum TaxID=344165 RepID=A0ABN2SFA6_9MICO